MWVWVSCDQEGLKRDEVLGRQAGCRNIILVGVLATHEKVSLSS